MSVNCGEGNVVFAKSDEGIDFGGVTSCMTITCILEDNSKVAGHDAVYKRVKPQIVYAMRGKIQSDGKGKKVARVVAAGAGSIWTPQMQSQQELFDGMKTADPSMKNLNDMQALNACAPFLVSNNKDKFKDILSRDFGVSKDNVSFTNHDFGRIQVSPAGALELEGA